MGTKTVKRYKRIDIWEHSDETTAVRYVCYQVIGKDEYCVQSSDYFNYPIDDNAINNSEKQAIELFIDMAPDERVDVYKSIEAAIVAHNEGFEE